MIMLLTNILNYQVIMNFKPQFFLMNNKVKKHDKHKLKAYFLRDTDIIIGLIFKMMKNQMIKQ